MLKKNILYKELPYFWFLYLLYWGRDSVVGITTRYGLGGSRFEPRWGEIFRTHPAFCAMGTESQGKAVGAWR